MRGNEKPGPIYRLLFFVHRHDWHIWCIVVDIGVWSLEIQSQAARCRYGTDLEHEASRELYLYPLYHYKSS
jgi:hypothetical protein